MQAARKKVDPLILGALNRDIIVIRADSSTPGCATIDPRIRTQPTLGESAPQVAGVLSASELDVGSDDGVAGVEERRATRLLLHAGDDKLNHERVAVLGDELARHVLVEVAQWDCAILERLRWEERRREVVLRDEALLNDPEDLGPDFTDGVYTPVTGLVKSLVRRRVDGGILPKT